MDMLRELVREIMISQGWEVFERPDPKYKLSEDLDKWSYYNPFKNTIYLWRTDDIPTMAHELCHSLQPPDENYVKPEENLRKYFSQNTEVQAYAIADWVSAYLETGQPAWRNSGMSKPSRKMKKKINAKAERELGYWRKIESGYFSA